MRGKMNFMKRCIISIFFLVVTPYYCLAEPYFGFSIGQSSSEKLQEHDITGELDFGFNGGEDLELFTQKTRDTAFKIFAGYNLKDWLGLEFGYVDLGENNFVAEDTTSTPSPNVTSHVNHIEAKVDLTGIYIAAMPKVLFSHGISANLKIGAISWDASGTLNRSLQETFTNNPPLNFSRTNSLSDNGTDLIIGLGISYGIYFLEYERLQMNPDDVDLIMLSLKFKLPHRMLKH